MLGKYMCHGVLIDLWLNLDNRTILEYNLSLCEMRDKMLYEKGLILHVIAMRLGYRGYYVTCDRTDKGIIP